MKKMILFLTTFIICAIVITITKIRITQYRQSQIMNHTDSVEETNKAVEQEKSDEKKFTGVDIYSTYNENDLLIFDKTASFNNVIEYVVPQIEGLKDKKVENRINEDMQKKIEDFVKKHVSKGKNDKYSYDVCANYGNVLSIRYRSDYSWNFLDEDNLYFNYLLTDGSILRFEDLFTEDADYVSIFREVIFRFYSNEHRGLTDVDFLYNNASESELEKIKKEESEWVSEQIGAFDDSDIYKIVKGFINKENKTFCFSVDVISVVYQDQMYYIPMQSNASSIGIYSQFLTSESIFEKDNIGKKDLWVFSRYNPFDFEDMKEKQRLTEFECGLLEDNLWFDNIISTSTKNFTYLNEVVQSNYEKVIDEEWNHQKEIVKEYQNNAKNNKQSFYIVYNDTFLSSDAIYNTREDEHLYTDLIHVQRRFFIYEIPIELYEKKYKSKLYNMHRYELILPTHRISDRAPLIDMGNESQINVQTVAEEYLIKLENFRVVSELEDFVQMNDSFYQMMRDKILKENTRIEISQMEDILSKLIFDVQVNKHEYQIHYAVPEYQIDGYLYQDELEDFMLIMKGETK